MVVVCLYLFSFSFSRSVLLPFINFSPLGESMACPEGHLYLRKGLEELAGDCQAFGKNGDPFTSEFWPETPDGC